MHQVSDPVDDQPLLPHHARELFEESGISPQVAARRGCRSIDVEEARKLGFASYQARPGLYFPEWSLAGRQLGGRLKPDNPRIGDNGKPIKYEAPCGSTPILDVHPDARDLVRDPWLPIWFTEGVKKADAAWSCGVLCVSLPGVWMYLHGKQVVPDLDEIALGGRQARVVFDSDVTRNPSVARALIGLCEALRRRGAKVEVVYLPEGENGAKVGLDDFFVAGGTVADIDKLARPWDGRGPGISQRETDDEIATLRLERDQAIAGQTALLRLCLNPNLSRSELTAAAALAVEVVEHSRKDDVREDGRVVLSAAEIANDWRSKPETGERWAPANPDGSVPRMARDRVKGFMGRAVEYGLIRAKPVPVTRTHADGSSYRATDWAIEPATTIASAIAPWANYRPAEPKVRARRTVAKPCPSCGEVHPLKRQDFCTGCGGLVAESIISQEPTPDPKPEPECASEDAASDNLSEHREHWAPAPIVRNGRKIIGGEAENVGDPWDDMRQSTPEQASMGLTGVPWRDDLPPHHWPG